MIDYYLYTSDFLKDIFYIKEEGEEHFHGIMVSCFNTSHEPFIGSDFYYPKKDCRKLEEWEVVLYKLQGKILNENDSKEKNCEKS